MLTPVPHLQPPQRVNPVPLPVPALDRMAMPVLIRACMARCSARLNRGLWERELLILASGDGLKTTGAKTSKHSLITLAHWTHPHMRTGTQVSMSQQFTEEEVRCMCEHSVKSHTWAFLFIIHFTLDDLNYKMIHHGDSWRTELNPVVIIALCHKDPFG